MSKFKTLRRSLLCGLGVLSLAAVGCGGGGGGTLVSPATLTLTNGVAPSLSRTSRSISKALGQLSTSNVTIDVFNLEGDLLDSLTGQSLPAKIKVNAATKAALLGNSAVFVVKDTSGKTFKTTVKVSSIGSGAIKGSDGNDLAEPVDAGSTVVTQLVEIELEKATGQSLTLGKKSSPAEKAAVKAFTSKANPSIDVSTLGESLKTASKVAGSALKVAIDAIKAGDQSPSEAVERPAPALRASLNTAKKVTRSSARLGGVAKANPTLATALNAKAALIAAIAPTATNFDKQLAGADSLSTVAEMAAENNGLFGASLTTLANTADLSTVVDTVISTVLPIAANNAGDLGTLADETATLLGTAMQTADATQNASLTDTFAAIAAVVADSSAFDSAVLASASGSTTGAGRAVSNIVNNGGDVSAAFAAAAASASAAGAGVGIGVGGAVSLSPSAIGFIVTATAAATGQTASDLLGTVSSVLSASTLQELAANTTLAFTISDEAKISGDTSAKTASIFSLLNNSIEASATATYTYKWTVGSLANGTVVETRDSASFTTTATAGTYSVTLEQSNGSTIVGTDTHTVVVAATLKPVVTLSSSSLSLVQGKSTVVNVTIVDPETRTSALTVTVSEVGTASAFTLGTLSATGGNLTILAKATALAKSYDITVVVNDGTTTPPTKTITVKVLALPNTKVSVFGVSDKAEGDSITFKAIAVQSKAITTGIFEINVTNTTSNTVVAHVTAVLSVGTSTLSTTISSLTSGSHTVEIITLDGTTPLKIISKGFNVKATGAPTFTTLTVGSNNALEFSDLNFVGAGLTGSALITAVATATPASSVVYTIKAGASMALAMASTPQTFGGTLAQTITIGKHYIHVMATANNKTVTKAFTVTYTQSKKLVVSTVMFHGNVANVTNGNLSNSVANNMYVMDATNVQNITLNTEDSLHLDIMVGTGTTALAGTGYRFEITLTDEALANDRTAKLIVVNATITGDSVNGFDVTTATSLDFSGTKANGSSATISVPVQTVITNFTPLFSPVAGGLRIDLIALRSAMEQILTGNSFASSLRTLNGENLTVMIKLTATNFSMENGSGAKFNAFKAINVKVN